MKELIEIAQHGDRKALRKLLMMHRALIEAVVRRFAWDYTAREDVMQNICMKVAGSIAEFNAACRFSTWIYRIAVNECIDSNRRHVRDRKKFEPLQQAGEIFPDLNAGDGLSSTLDKESRSEVLDAVAKLPEGMRMACELYYLQQKSGEEAAENLQISLPAFFVRLSAARVRLKKELLKKGFEYDG
jgi:RNA polymerase sigma-70 factor (ECF subfamily)